MEIYEPREDTFLILKQIEHFASGNVLDMGTGSGVLAIEAAQTADNVIGVDINKDAVEFASEQAKDYPNVQFFHSDLFSYFKKNPMKFDLIIFNPPYLPEDKKEPKESALATTGGKKGHEVLERFFSEVSEYLMPYGRILVIFSSLTGKDKTHEILEEYAFDYQKLAEKEEFMETLFVYIIEKSDLLRAVEWKGIKNVKKIAKGHRGFIFIGNLEGKKVVVKKQRDDKPVTGRIVNEARWLKVLNRKGIGPKFLFLDVKNNYFCYEYVEGEFIPSFLEKAPKDEIKKVLKDVFEQCFKMDMMGIDKEEMHNPYKHVLVEDGKAVLLDFERVHSTEKPKNVTQFMQYVGNKRNTKILKEKGIKVDMRKWRAAARRYKKEENKENFKKILSLLS
ncbi:methyltransferase [Candidatus Woesearchaeota archaeon]|nr:methyltransferase [Candidatus Woesearchaeota archaeon]